MNIASELGIQRNSLKRDVKNEWIAAILAEKWPHVRERYLAHALERERQGKEPEGDSDVASEGVSFPFFVLFIRLT
jgi:hypothetical protein